MWALGQGRKGRINSLNLIDLALDKKEKQYALGESAEGKEKFSCLGTSLSSTAGYSIHS